MARQPKQTVTLPFETWMRGPLRETVRDGLDTLRTADVGVRGLPVREFAG
jgi:hypothetical protein